MYTPKNSFIFQEPANEANHGLWFCNIAHLYGGLLHRGRKGYEVSKLGGCLFVQSAAAHLSLIKC